MGRKIFASMASKRKIPFLKENSDIDRTLLDCKVCRRKTPHVYEGFRNTDKTEYLYRCKEVYVSDRRF